MRVYILDENLPTGVPFWNNEKFVHVSSLAGIESDTDIWQYAMKANLIIVTKDADFYHRYLASINCPKVIWLKVGNMRKRDFNLFVHNCWAQVESLLLLSSFIVVEQDKMEGF